MRRLGQTRLRGRLSRRQIISLLKKINEAKSNPHKQSGVFTSVVNYCIQDLVFGRRFDVDIAKSPDRFAAFKLQIMRWESLQGLSLTHEQESIER